MEPLKPPFSRRPQLSAAWLIPTLALLSVASFAAPASARHHRSLHPYYRSYNSYNNYYNYHNYYSSRPYRTHHYAQGPSQFYPGPPSPNLSRQEQINYWMQVSGQMEGQLRHTRAPQQRVQLVNHYNNAQNWIATLSGSTYRPNYFVLPGTHNYHYYRTLEPYGYGSAAMPVPSQPSQAYSQSNYPSYRGMSASDNFYYPYSRNYSPPPAYAYQNPGIYYNGGNYTGSNGYYNGAYPYSGYSSYYYPSRSYYGQGYNNYYGYGGGAVAQVAYGLMNAFSPRYYRYSGYGYGYPNSYYGSSYYGGNGGYYGYRNAGSGYYGQNPYYGNFGGGFGGFGGRGGGFGGGHHHMSGGFGGGWGGHGGFGGGGGFAGGFGGGFGHHH